MAYTIENGIQKEIIIPKETSDIDYKYKSLELTYRLADDSVKFVKGSIRDINEFVVKYWDKEIEDKCYTWFDFVFNAQLQLIKENALLTYNYLKAKGDKDKLKKLAKLVNYLDRHCCNYTDYLNEPRNEQELWDNYNNNEFNDKSIMANNTALFIYKELEQALEG